MNFKDYDYKERCKEVEDILKNTDTVEKVDKFPKKENFTYTNGYKAWATAIFVDIRGSTSLFTTNDDETKEIEASKVVRGFTSEVIEILNKDTNDQDEDIGVRGDCVYAIYSTPKKKDIFDVWRRSEYINTYMKLYNNLLSKQNLPNIKVGIGIASAETVAVKAGRKSSGINDRVWIGNAISIASKLSNVANKKIDDEFIRPIAVSGDFKSNLDKYYDCISKDRADFTSHYSDNIGIFYSADYIMSEFDKWINDKVHIIV